MTEVRILGTAAKGIGAEPYKANRLVNPLMPTAAAASPTARCEIAR